jgi:hypothetical protein
VYFYTFFNLLLPFHFKFQQEQIKTWNNSGHTIGGSITVLLTSCLTGLDLSVLQIKTKIVSCHTADSKPDKQEVNGIMILPPLVFPEQFKFLNLENYS